MASLEIHDSSIPDLTGRSAIVTGGSSGIGLATSHLLSTKGATVYNLDLKPPLNPPSGSQYISTDVTSWPSLLSAFRSVDHIDIVYANAGIVENEDLLNGEIDAFDAETRPSYRTLDVNVVGVLNTVRLAWSKMKAQKDIQERGGSIVLTVSAVAFTNEHSLPVYNASKLALVSLVRTLRPTLILHNITINAVAPGATQTPVLLPEIANPMRDLDLKIASAEHVARALVFSATGRQSRRVDWYGKDDEAEPEEDGRWNGRIILTMDDRYTELEESIARLRPDWIGKENERLTRIQQKATDWRQ